MWMNERELKELIEEAIRKARENPEELMSIEALTTEILCLGVDEDLAWLSSYSIAAS